MNEPKNGYVTYRALFGIITPLIFSLVTIASGLFSWIWNQHNAYQDRRIESIEKKLDRLEDRVQIRKQ